MSVEHTCNWPGCTLTVSSRKWGCSTHWYMLPPHLRAKIWISYGPRDSRPNLNRDDAYLEIMNWIYDHYPELKHPEWEYDL